MTLTLELPPEGEGALADEARRKGTMPKQLVLEDLRQRYPVHLPPALTTPEVHLAAALWRRSAIRERQRLPRIRWTATR